MPQTLEQTLNEFSRQFEYEPGIANADTLGEYKKYVLLGMGGSHLAGDILLRMHPDIDMVVWSDYGLPPIADLSERLVIVSSYSGNTEEVLDGLRVAGEQGIPTAIITTGGALKDIAQQKRLPYVELPATGIQPRNALGYTLVGLLKVLRLEEDLAHISTLKATLTDGALKTDGQELAIRAVGRVPVFYTSRANKTLAYNWKIKCNETTKIPAFYNIFPELNHNELAGMDVIEKTKELSKQYMFFFITDTYDHERVQLRMRVTKELYAERGLITHEMSLDGETAYERIFRSIVRADWFSFTLARHYETDPNTVPIIEQFKQLIS